MYVVLCSTRSCTSPFCRQDSFYIHLVGCHDSIVSVNAGSNFYCFWLNFLFITVTHFRDSTKHIMLSRVALSRGAQAQQVLVRGLSVSAPNMERDLVNFPPRVRPVEKAPVRCLVFPEEWFTACYSKTGVTGPYMFLVGVGTFLASKEFFVMEHDFYVGLGLAAVLTLVVKQVISVCLFYSDGLVCKNIRPQVGPDWTAEINKELDEEEANLRAIRQNEIDAIKTEIALEKESQLDAAAYTDIIAAKKEAVGLQLEASYRARLVEAHSAVRVFFS